jgi:hypothetical protein
VTAPCDPRPATYGYLLVVEDELHGYTGGLLVVCDRGRPLEFHCTEPVQPSSAQRILFGPTLRGYVCGQQIGGALLAKLKGPLGVLLTNDDDTSSAGREAGLTTLVLSEGELLPECLLALAASIDPVEPFDRVREAIREAQRGAGAGDDRAAA